MSAKMYLVISDAHANYDALARVLESLRYENVIFLGDSVDYGPQPAETLDLLKEVGAIMLKGNHDAAAAHGISCRCAEELRPLSEYTRERITMNLLSKEDLKFLADLPEKIELEIDGRRVYAVHASPKNHLYGYVMPDMSDEELESELYDLDPMSPFPRKLDHDLVLLGHTHRAMMRELSSLILNPGSVGQPRDRDPRASFALIGEEIKLGRIEYDVESTVRKIKDLKLEKWAEESLISILRTGSLDKVYHESEPQDET
jgi:protein phosphatase